MHCFRFITSSSRWGLGSRRLSRPITFSHRVSGQNQDVRKISASSTSGATTRISDAVSRNMLGGLLLAGATLGPLLDGIHGTVGLLKYKASAIIDLARTHHSQACASNSDMLSFSAPEADSSSNIRFWASFAGACDWNRRTAHFTLGPNPSRVLLCGHRDFACATGWPCHWHWAQSGSERCPSPVWLAADTEPGRQCCCYWRSSAETIMGPSSIEYRDCRLASSPQCCTIW